MDRVGLPPRTPTRITVWIATAAIAALAALGLASVDAPVELSLQTRAEALLPPDGDASLLTSSDGARWVVETALTIGVAALLQQPPTAGGQLIGVLLEESGEAGLLSTRFLRQFLTDPEGRRPQATLVATVGADGVRLRSVTGTPNGMVYSPGPLLLPAEVAAGDTWSDAGASADGTVAYEYSARASDAHGTGAGCLLVESSLVLTPTTGSSAQPASSRTEERATWCPSRGVVASSVTVDGETTRLVAGPLEGLPSGAPGADPDALVSWRDPAGWEADVPAMAIVDPVFGRSDFPLALAGPAAATADGVSVMLAGTELVAWRAEDGWQVRAWIAHPGATVVGLGAAGELVLATTSERRVVAYASTGARGWSAEFGDVVLDAPVPDGAGGLVAVALDGEVRSLGAADGATRWSFALGSDAEAAATVADGLVIAGDRGGRVVALGVDDGQPRWSSEADAVGQLAVLGDLVVVAHPNGGLTALDLQTGARRWEADTPAAITRLLAVGDVVAALGAEGVMAWGADGSVAWRADGMSLGLVSDGGVAVALGAAEALGIAPDGSRLAQWPLTAPALGIGRVLVATQDGVWLIDSNHAVTTLGPR